MMALVGYACTDDERNPVETPDVPPSANSLAVGATAGYDLNFDNTPTPEAPQTVNIYSSDLTINGVTGPSLGEWTFPTPYKVGTGVINPFMRIQASPSESGLNTDNGTPYDTKSGTRSLPLNYVPVLVDPEFNTPGGQVRQFILDANENNNKAGDWRISIDEFDVFLCAEGGDQVTTHEELHDDCVKLYDIDGGGEAVPQGTTYLPGPAFATDALTSGSGKTLDYDILIANEAFEGALIELGGTAGECQYNGVDSDPCGYWVVVYAEMGGFGADGDGFNWTTDATFEEFSTIIQPWVEVDKTATATYTRTHNWLIEKSVDKDAHVLFTGQSGSSGYTVTVTPDGKTDSDWVVAGTVTINNPSNDDVIIESITDYLTPGDIPITLDCGSPGPTYDLAAGGQLVCSYDFDGLTQEQIDNAPEGFTNNVEVQLQGLALYSATATFDFDGAPTVEYYKTVNVTDLFVAALSQLGTADWNEGGTATVFSYSRDFTCGEETGEWQYDNTATIEETNQTDDASVTLTCLDLDVSKTADTDLERTYLWTIDKSVSPASWDLFEGDDATSEYTVTVTPDGVSDAKWNVSGVITITNNNAVSVFIDAVSDEIAGLGSVTLDCGTATFPDYELTAGSSLECSYSQDMPNGDGGNNAASVTATATDDGPTKQFGDDVDFSFAEATLTNVNKTIDVVDTWPYADYMLLEDWDHDDGQKVVNYDRTFSCDDEGENPNTATIVETQQSDDAMVTVTCYALEVTKDADTDFTRTYKWDIEKSAEPGTHTLFAGQSGETEYTVKVSPNGYQDSQWAADGTITVSNPAPMDAMLLALTDEVDGVPATVDCPSMTVPAGGTLQCTYSTALPSGSDGTNVATATQQNYSYDSDLSATDAGTTQYEGDADVLFGDPTTEINKTVNVTDLFDGLLEELGPAGWDGPATTFEYKRTFSCSEEYGSEQYDNTATITETGQSDDASVTLNCLNVEVSKDFATYKTRTYNWEIDKTATPASWQLFDGDQGTTKYDVTVGLDDQNPYDDSGWMVDGEITVHNPNALSVWIQSVSDLMSPDIAAVVTCEGISFPYELTAGSDLVCGYLADSPDDSDRTNTATVSAKPTASGTAKDFTGSADVSFAEVEVTEVNKTVQVEDSWPAANTFLGSVDAVADGSKTFTYDRVFACGNVTGADDVGAGTYDNTASIVDPAMSDDASVTVECYDLTVTKDASTAWTRAWTWDINKDVDASKFLDGTYDAQNGVATVGEGQSLTVWWDIDLSASSLDYGYAASGNIKVSNAGNPIAATINDVSDLIDGSLSAAVNCGVTFPYTLAAGAELDCTYSADLTDASTLGNTATAEQQNYAYGSDLSSTMSGTTDYSGVADIVFSNIPTTEIDECVDLSDVLEQGGLGIDSAMLGDGDWCANDGLPTSFEVSFEFGGDTGIPLVCDDNLFNNTASFVTNDTQTTGSDDAPINIYQDCVEGCTLTQGYWKTHSLAHNNGKQYDDRWLNIGAEGENTDFFYSGESWITVFWTAPKGNAYYNLAHQYMAAKLNMLAGADAPQEVMVAINQAEAWLNTPSNTPAAADALKGQEAKKLRDWASIFASFNEGLIGPGHCTEEQMDEIRNG